MGFNSGFKGLNTPCEHNEQFLEALAKQLQKTTISFVMYLSLDLAPPGRIVAKFCSCDFCWSLISSNLAKIWQK